jgi:competence protein ComEC
MPENSTCSKPGKKAATMLVDFINVGYGDAILLRDDNFTMLVDCGDTDTGFPYAGSRRISARDFLRQAGIHRLDLLVLSHLHRDHSGGLLDICRDFEIGEFWTTYLPPKVLQKKIFPQNSDWGEGVNNIILALNIYTQAFECLHKKDASIRLVQNKINFISPGQKLKIECACAEKILYQRQQEILDSFLLKTDSMKILDPGVIANLDELNKFINDTSLRLSIQYGDCVILLPGDVSAEYWMNDPPEQCSILKVSHHGHSDAVTEKLLQILQPEYAIISVSNDRQDGCPDKEIVDMIRQYVKECFFTDAISSPIVDAEKSLHYSVQFRIEETGIMKYQPVLS